MIKFFIGLISIILLLFYFINIRFSNRIYKYIYCFILLLFSSIILSYPYEKSTDFRTYNSYFFEINNLDFPEIFSYKKFETLFTAVTWLHLKNFDHNPFFSFLILINLILVLAIYLFYKNKLFSILSLTFYIIGPIFFSMSTNIIRQMLVVSLILLFFSIRKKTILVVLPFIHASSFFIVIFIFIQKFISLRFLTVLNLFAVFLFLLNFNKFFMTFIGFNTEYTSDISFKYYGASGNRLDFLCITILIVFIGYILYKNKIIDLMIYKYTLFTNFLFLMLGFQAFSERIALYNWILLIYFIPLIIYLISKKYKIVNYSR